MTQTATAPTVWYTVETVGSGCRYAGPDFNAAVSAVLSLDTDASEEGRAVATVNGAHSPSESDRVETTAMRLVAATAKGDALTAQLVTDVDHPGF